MSPSTGEGETCIFRAVDQGTRDKWIQVSAWLPQRPLSTCSTLRHATSKLQLEGPTKVFPQLMRTTAGYVPGAESQALS